MRMSYIRAVEDLTDFVTHCLIDSLKIELGSQGSLYAVDDRQLGIALFGLLEQALGLVEETGIFQGHAHRVGQGLQQAYIRFAEGVFTFHILQIDQAARLIADDKWNENR